MTDLSAVVEAVSIHYPSQFAKWAHSAWRRFDMSPPVELAVIADFFGIKTIRDTLAPGIKGMYCRDDAGDATIIIQGALPFREQRWVWAHEIGHHLMSQRDLRCVTFECSVRNACAQIERDCDEFAWHLLMPALHVTNKAECIGHPEIDRTGALAEAFGVGIDQMRIRLRQLGISAGRYREWLPG